MHILVIPLGLILWYFAYEAKPIINDEATDKLKKNYVKKRNRLLSILNESI